MRPERCTALAERCAALAERCAALAPPPQSPGRRRPTLPDLLLAGSTTEEKGGGMGAH